MAKDCAAPNINQTKHQPDQTLIRQNIDQAKQAGM